MRHRRRKGAAWHPDGRRAERGTFLAGQPENRWFADHPDGALAEEGVYLEGRPHGPWICLHANGAPSVRATLEEGRPVGLWRWFDAAGVESGSRRFGPGAAPLVGRGRAGLGPQAPSPCDLRPEEATIPSPPPPEGRPPEHPTP